MSEQSERHNSPRPSRQRYLDFVQEYRRRRLDAAEATAGGEGPTPPETETDVQTETASNESSRGKRREYLRAYICCLRPHRYAVGAIFLYALVVAALEMIEPLFL